MIQLRSHPRLRALYVTCCRWPVLALAVLVGPSASVAAFNPPVVVRVVNSGEERLYFIDRGLDANIKVGDVLNVFRVKRSRSSSGATKERILIGTMAIRESEEGVSLGHFVPDVSLAGNIEIRMKTPVRTDLVIPKLKIDSSVLFEPGLASLQAAVVGEELDKVAEFVRSFSPSKLIVEGHTDSDGDVNANQTLSERRAEMVRRYLIDNYPEITDEMVTARGYGETRPLVANDSAANRALNRRIEIVVWE